MAPSASPSPTLPVPANSSSALYLPEWVKWAAGVLLTLNASMVGGVVRYEARMTAMETAFNDHQRKYDDHVQDAKTIRAGIEAKLHDVDTQQTAILAAIADVRVNVAALTGHFGIKPRPAAAN